MVYVPQGEKKVIDVCSASVGKCFLYIKLKKELMYFNFLCVHPFNARIAHTFKMNTRWRS